MKLTKRAADLLAAGCIVLSAFAMMPYELEKIPVPPAIKGWLAVVCPIIGAFSVAIRNQLPSFSKPDSASGSPVSDEK